MVSNKKAISPVVATALLLVVAVVAVVGFQTWFNTYQSGLNTKVEQQSASGSSITIERLESNSTDCIVYIKNTAAEAVLITKVTAGAGSNTTATNVSTGIKEFNVGTCNLADGTAADVVVLSDAGIFQETEIVR